MSYFSVNSEWLKNYVNQLDVMAFNDQRPLMSYEQFDEGMSSQRQASNEIFLNNLRDSMDLVPEYTYRDYIDDAKENLLEQFRFNFSEQEERSKKRDEEREFVASLANSEELTLYDETNTDIVNKLRKATEDNIPLWKVYNPGRFFAKETGKGSS